jgi:hypothetical protein
MADTGGVSAFEQRRLDFYDAPRSSSLFVANSVLIYPSYRNHPVAQVFDSTTESLVWRAWTVVMIL